MSRARVLDALAGRIASMSLGRPIRVAIDGRLGSGKTMMAEELAALLRARGRRVIRASIDGFHRPKTARYARGRSSPQGYYEDAYDLDAVATLLLRPLGPDGDRRYRLASFDLENDRPLNQEPCVAPADAILVMDGTFLQRPELRSCFDVAIHVAAADEIATARAVKRDAAQFHGIAAAEQIYAERYRPAFVLYDRLCTPQSRADVAIDNDDLANPGITIRPDGRLGTVT